MAKRGAARAAVLALVCVVLSVVCLPGLAWANTDSGAVRATLTSDKESYEPGDIGTFSLKLENTQSVEAKNVAYEFELPDGASVVKGYESTGTIDSLTSGATSNVDIKVKFDKAATVGGLPKTGDSSLTLILAAGGALLGGALLFAGLRSKNRSLMAVLAICLAVAAAGASQTPAYANEGVFSTTASRTVKVGTAEKTVKAHVTYATAQNDTGEGGDEGGDQGGDNPSQGGNEPKVSYVLQEGVRDVDDYEVLGENRFLVHGKDNFQTRGVQARLAVDDKAVFQPKEGNLCGAAGAVVSAEELANGDTIVEIKQATKPQDVFESLSISAEDQQLDLGDAEWADGVTTASTASSRSKVPLGNYSLSLEKEIPNVGKLHGSLSLNPSIDVDVKWTLKNGLVDNSKIVLSQTCTLDTGFDLKQFKGSIPLLTKPVAVPIGATPFSVAFNLDLVVSATGKAEAKASITQSVGASFKNGAFTSINQSKSTASLYLEAKGETGAEPYAMARIFKIDLVDLSVGAGLDGSGKATLRDTGMLCVDLQAHVYMDLAVGTKTEWLQDAKLTHTWQLWNEDSSPVKLAGHFENMEQVPECTYGKDTPTDPDKPVDPDKPTDPDQPGAESVFKQIAGDYVFTRGVGGWGTEMNLKDDGTFTGVYTDSNLGITGTDYPKGTVYIARFSGKFSEPTKVNDLTYSMNLESLELEQEPGYEYIEDGVRYICSEAYGLNNGKEFMVYAPGSVVSELPEGFAQWLSAFDAQKDGKLTLYGIYNVNEEEGFVAGKM